MSRTLLSVGCAVGLAWSDPLEGNTFIRKISCFVCHFSGPARPEGGK